MSIKHKNTNTQGPKGPRAIFTSQNLDAPVGTWTLLPEPQLSDLSRPNFSWIYESYQSHTLITLVLHLSTHLSMCQICASDHATHWKCLIFSTPDSFTGCLELNCFVSFLRSKAPVHVNGLESTSMSPLSWGRSVIANNCQSSNKILCYQKKAPPRQSPLGSWKSKWPTLPVPLSKWENMGILSIKHIDVSKKQQQSITFDSICSILFVLHDSKTPQICTARSPLCGETSIEMLEKNVSSTERRCNVL